MKNNCIITFCAHNDDQIIGAGGTLAKYSKEGRKVITCIFSYGESSHPHLKKEVTAKMRIIESKKANRMIGGSDIIYFGIKEGKIQQEIEQKCLEEKIAKIISKYKPQKIFTHSIFDPHPDHKAVYRTIRKVTEDMNFNGEIYSFDIWNIINFRRRHDPKLIVDITDTFQQKIQAFKCNQSQKLTIFSLLWNTYLKAFLNGIHNNMRYAEVFYKIR